MYRLGAHTEGELPDLGLPRAQMAAGWQSSGTLRSRRSDESPPIMWAPSLPRPLRPWPALAPDAMSPISCRWKRVTGFAANPRGEDAWPPPSL
jgi:hypothetical protein